VALKWGISPEERAASRLRNWLRWLLYRWAALRTALLQLPRRLAVRLIRYAERKPKS